MIDYFILRSRVSKRVGRTGEVARKKYKVRQGLRVRIVLVVEIVETGLAEMASFC